MPVAPSQVWIEFSEPVDRRLTNVTVLDAERGRVDDGQVSFGPGARVTVGLALENGTLPDGGYIIHWSTFSTFDGHKTQGALGFAVGNATLLEIPEDEAPEVDPKAVVGKSAAFIGLTLLIGALVFEPWVLPRGSLVRGIRTLALLGAAVQAVGLGLLAWSQVEASGLAPRFYLWQTSFGQGLMWRTLLCLLALALLRIRSTPFPNAQAWATRAAALALVVLYGAFSHTAATLQVFALGLVLDAVHLTAVAAWMGGLACLVVFLKSLDSHPEAGPALLAHISRRFHRLALACVAVLLVTGLLMIVVLVGPNPARWWDLRSTPYGILLAAKVAVALLMMGMGGFNRTYFVARFLRHHAFHLRQGFRAFVSAEVALGVVVLVLAGALTNYSPQPADAAGPAEPLVLDDANETLRFHVTINPPPSAANESQIRVLLTRAADGSPVEDAFRVRLTFRYLDTDLGGSSVLAEPAGGGVYQRNGSFFPTPGRWELEVSASTPDVFLEAVRFELDVP